MARSSDPIRRVVGPVHRVTELANGVELAGHVGVRRVEVIADGVVRLRASPSGAWRPPRSWDVLRVPSTPPDLEVAVAVDDDTVVVVAGGLCVAVARPTGVLRVSTVADAELLADDGPGAVSWHDGNVRWQLRRHLDERHAGFGERSTLDQTVGTKTIWNTNARQYGPDTDRMYCSVPFFLAHRPGTVHGCFLDTAGWARFTGDPELPVWSAEAAGAELSLVVVHGDSPATVLERFTGLAGRTERPPAWALGYHQSHWGYDSADAVRAVAVELVGRRLPADAIHLDITYMDAHRVFTWDPARFPDPSGLVADLRRSGLRCVAIVDPGVALQPGDRVFEAGGSHDAFLRRPGGELVTGYVWPGRCAFPDFLRDDVRSWWADLHGVLLDAGVAGIWSDMNEPAIYAEPIGSTIAATVVEVPADAVHRPPDGPVAHADVHNLYGLSMASAATEAAARLRPDERTFTLTRSGFAGIQRHAAVWTGDNSSTWEHLRLSLPMLCNLGLSGVPFVGADIGGFWGDCEPELFARWIQAGVVYPLMRAHSHQRSRRNEPWAFGPEVEAVARRALRLRRRLRPYLATLFDEAATTGAPVLRPLLFEFPDDPAAAAVEDEVLLGHALLAAPVLHPGARSRLVYLPPGRWYEWWTGGAHDGPTEVVVDAPLEHLPLFARGGTLVPVAAIDDDGAIDDHLLILRVSPGAGGGVLYEDDGSSFEHRRGGFARRRYEVRSLGVGAHVRLSATEGAYRPPSRSLVFRSPGGAEVAIDDTPTELVVTLP